MSDSVIRHLSEWLSVNGGMRYHFSALTGITLVISKSTDSLFGFCYNMSMKQNVLSQTNPHLSNESKARKELIRSLASSTAIETGESIKTIEKKLIIKHFSRFPVTLA